MSIVLFPSIDGLRQNRVHRYTTLWRIERTDNTNLLFTDHDRPINFNYQAAIQQATDYSKPVAGLEELYTPVDAVTATATQKQSGVKDHNVDFTGVILSSGAIKEDDLRVGKYRNAKVVEILVDWKVPDAGFFYRNVYYIKQVSYTREFWKCSVSGVPAWMQQEIGHVYAHTCRWTLGDKHCKVNLAALAAGGAITALVGDGRSFSCSGAASTGVADYFDYGYLQWNTGNNAGTKSDIQTSTGAAFTLFLNPPLPMQVGDGFTAFPGCNKTKGDCVTKFNNFNRNGGFPYIPGNDAMLRGPLL